MKEHIMLCALATSFLLLFSGCADKKQTQDYTSKLDSVSKSITDKNFNSAEKQLDELLKADINDKDVKDKVQALKDKLAIEKEKEDNRVKADSIKELVSKGDVDTASKELEALESKNITDEDTKKLVDESKNALKVKQGEVKKQKEGESKKQEQTKKSENLLNKEKYMTKLKEIEGKTNNPNTGKTTMEMKSIANERYMKWDSALNEIYGVLKQGLKPDVMNELKNEEIKWIAYRDNTASKESEDVKGGTLEGLQRTCTLERVTKERCYELVEKYMK